MGKLGTILLLGSIVLFERLNIPRPPDTLILKEKLKNTTTIQDNWLLYYHPLRIVSSKTYSHYFYSFLFLYFINFQVLTKIEHLGFHYHANILIFIFKVTKTGFSWCKFSLWFLLYVVRIFGRDRGQEHNERSFRDRSF